MRLCRSSLGLVGHGVRKNVNEFLVNLLTFFLFYRYFVLLFDFELYLVKSCTCIFAWLPEFSFANPFSTIFHLAATNPLMSLRSFNVSFIILSFALRHSNVGFVSSTYPPTFGPLFANSCFRLASGEPVAISHVYCK